jgi:N-acetylglucosaminyldiphosphoundecaprenol N-acetyl-beta-D-mannosaminyltransferase
MADFSNQDIIILGVRIHDLNLKQILAQVNEFLSNDEFNLIFSPNPEICLKAEADSDYRKLLNKADLNIPDGVGLKVGAEILGLELANRITGVDLTKEILNLLNQQNGKKILIINRKDGLSSLDLIKKTLAEQYPNIQLTGIEISNPDLNKISVQINKELPDVVFAVLGAPEQEMILVDLQNRGVSAQLGLAVGGSFDFITGQQKRAPKWWRDLGIEWFYRLIQQPHRIGRIKDATVKFPLTCYQWKKRIETQYRPNVLAVITQSNTSARSVDSGQAGSARRRFLIQQSRRFRGRHWQFPQGGVDQGEKPETTVIREAAEELGAPEKSFKIIKQLPIEHKYDFPRWAKLLYGYKGQKQQIFLIEYLGSDQDFNFDQSDEVEDIKWVEKQDLINFIHPKRQESLKLILNYI